MNEIRPAEVRRHKVRTAEVRPAEIRPGEVRFDEIRLAKVHLVEVRLAEGRLTEVCPVEVRPAEVHLAKVRLAEVRDYFGVCLSPVIPSQYTFLDFCEMFAVRHGVGLSLALIISCRGDGGKISGHRVIGRSKTSRVFAGLTGLLRHDSINFMAKARYHYNIMLRPEPEGGYTALVPALPGCVTYG